ncbi:MAG: Glu/Leu/Phe/Val dehydrogenase dimerization domain-containing protein [Alphaproteobacteria bacterium]|nr:Glu/Leu/Phe/Val dehydrogenase dimerization domain-containing protein [Alphaproteobacteria bacterium]
MSIFSSPAFDDHEEVLFFDDPATGLRAIIAIHDTTLGPAAGGCRMKTYDSEDDAVTDALRLSRGMTYKAVMANLPYGGGKSVIIGDPHSEKTEALFRAFGRAVESLGGRYHTGEDMGVTMQDMDWAAQESAYVHGTTASEAQDPSPDTAVGVLAGIIAAVKHKLGRHDLKGLGVAVQGLGNVGYHLCRLLAAEGARLSVADVDADLVARCAAEFEAVAVPSDEIYAVDAEVFAPCAVGAILNDQTIGLLECDIVAGSANNQLLEERHGQALSQAGILYAPDYVINAGGFISVADEMVAGRRDEQRVLRRLHGIGDLLGEIFSRAASEGRATSEIADAIAGEKLAAKKAG